MLSLRAKRVTANILLTVLLGNPLFASTAAFASSKPIVSTSVPKRYRATTKHSANNTPVYDIVKPSKKGVSHNKYFQFNIGKEGAIFNNSYDPSVSQLGGWLDGNRNLAGGSAKIILNEVVGRDASQLNGFAEVAGQSAEFIVANPNGITCSGCGFINTPHVTLATGTPSVVDGDLNGFDIGNGHLSIDGDGLNASNVDRFSILSRAININAALYANDLDITTGTGYVDYKTKQFSSTSTSDTDRDYEYALDVSAIGGMYANSIVMIGTEQGLGVRSDGYIQANELTLDSDGEIRLSHVTSAGTGNIISRSDSIENTGSLSANSMDVSAANSFHNGGTLWTQGNLNIAAAEINNEGNIYYGLNDDGTFSDSALLILNATDQISNSGQLLGLGDGFFSSDQFNNNGNIQSNNINLIANNGLENRGTIYSSNNLKINTPQLLNDGTLYSVAKFNLSTDAISNNGNLISEDTFSLTSGVLENNGLISSYSQNDNYFDIDNLNNQGTFSVNAEYLNLSLSSLHNSGEIKHFGNGVFHIDSTSVTNADSGNVISNGVLNISSDAINNSGVISAVNNLKLDGSSLTNTGNLITNNDLSLSFLSIDNNSGNFYGENISISDNEQLNNSGTVSANNNINISTDGITNSLNGVLSGNDVTITSNDGILSNYGQISASQNLGINSFSAINNSKYIIAGNDIKINSDILLNSGVIQATDSVRLDNHSQLNSSGTIFGDNLTIAANELVNSGVVSVQHSLSIDSENIENSTGLITGDELYVRADNLTNDQGTITGVDKLAISVSHSLTNNSGQILTDASDATINTHDLTNGSDGVIQARNDAGTLTLTTQILNNQGEVSSVGDLSVTTDQLDNAGLLAANGVLTAQGQLTNAGQISGQQLELSGAGLDNQGQLLATEDLTIHHTTILNSGLIQSGGDSEAQGTSLVNRGQWLTAGHNQLSVDSIDNQSGLLHGEQGLTLTADQLRNQGGTVQSAGALSLITAQLNNQQGQLLGQNVDITATQQLNNDAGVIAGDHQLTLNTPSLTNEAGVIQGGNVSVTSATLDNGGTLAASGQLTLQSETLTNRGVLQGQQVDISATDALHNQGQLGGDTVTLHTGLLDNQQGMVLATGTDGESLVLDTNTPLQNQGGVLQSAGTTLTLGAVDNTAGQILLQGQGPLQLGTLNNTEGTVYSAGAIAQQGTLTNQQGQLVAEQAMTLTNGGDIDNRAGLIQAGGALSVSGRSLDNTDGELVAGNHLTATIDGTLNNANGLIQNQSGILSLGAARLNNQNGVVFSQSTDAATIAADHIDNTNGLLAAQGTLNLEGLTLTNHLGEIGGRDINIDSQQVVNTAGVIQGSRKLFVKTQSLTNDDGVLMASGTASDSLVINATADVTNGHAGQIVSDGGINLTASTVSNQGLVSAVGPVLLTVNQADNDGQIESGDALSLSGNNINNAGILLALGDITLSGNNNHTDNSQGILNSLQGNILFTGTVFSNEDGSVVAANTIDISADNKIDNNQGVIDGKNIKLKTQALTNQAGALTADNVAIQANTIDNSSGTIFSGSTANNSFTINANSLNNNNGVIATNEQNGKIDLAALSNNNGQLLHQGNGSFTVNVTDELSSSGAIASNGSLNIDAGSIANSGTMAATQQLSLGADNELSSTGLVQANRINIFADNLTNDGQVNAQNNLNINVNKTVTNNGQLFSEDGTLTIANNTLTNNGVISGNNLTINSNKINNTARLQAKEKTVLNAADIANHQDGIINGSSVDIAQNQTLNNQGILQGQDVSIHGAVVNNSGAINATGSGASSLILDVTQLNNKTSGEIYTNSQNLTISALLNNSGTIAHYGSGLLSLGQGGAITNSGQIQSLGSIALSNGIHGQGSVYADQQLTLGGDHFTNDAAQLIGNGSVVVNSSLNNQGQILSNGTLSINSHRDVTNAGLLQGNQLSIDANQLNNTGSLIARGTNGHSTIGASVINNANGSIQSAGTGLTLNGGSINNNQGQIISAGALIATANQSSLTNHDGVIVAQGTSQITTHGSLDNQNGTIAAGAMTLVAEGDFVNDAGVIQAISGNGSGQSTISARNLSNQNGVIASDNRDLSITATQTLDVNSGQLVHAGTGTLTLQAANLNVAGSGQVNTNGNLSAVVDDRIDNQGIISSAGNAELQATTINNHNLIASRGGSLALKATGKLNNQQQLTALNTLQLTSDTLSNKGTLQADNAIVSQSDAIQDLGTLSAGNIYLSNKASMVIDSDDSLTALGELSLSSDHDITNNGQVQTQGALLLSGQHLVNNNRLKAGAGVSQLDFSSTITNNANAQLSSTDQLAIKGANISNNGTIAAGNVLQLQGNHVTNTDLLYAGQQLNVFAAQIDNTDGGTLYSSGNMVLAKDSNNGKATSVSNIGSTIAAGQDLQISANQITNKRLGVTYNDEGVSRRETKYNEDPNKITPPHETTITGAETTVTEYSAVATGADARIVSGRNMSLIGGDITNEYGTIAAGNDLYIAGNNFSNASAANKIVTQTQQIEFLVRWNREDYECDRKTGHNCGAQYSRVIHNAGNIGDPTYQTEYTGGAFGSVTAGGSISGNLAQSFDNVGDTGAFPNAVNITTSGSKGSAQRGNSANAGQRQQGNVNGHDVANQPSSTQPELVAGAQVDGDAYQQQAVNGTNRNDATASWQDGSSSVVAGQWQDTAPVDNSGEGIIVIDDGHNYAAVSDAPATHDVTGGDTKVLTAELQPSTTVDKSGKGIIVIDDGHSYASVSDAPATQDVTGGDTKVLTAELQPSTTVDKDGKGIIVIDDGHSYASVSDTPVTHDVAGGDTKVLTAELQPSTTVDKSGKGIIVIDDGHNYASVSNAPATQDVTGGDTKVLTAELQPSTTVDKSGKGIIVIDDGRQYSPVSSSATAYTVDDAETNMTMADAPNDWSGPVAGTSLSDVDGATPELSYSYQAMDTVTKRGDATLPVMHNASQANAPDAASLTAEQHQAPQYSTIEGADYQRVKSGTVTTQPVRVTDGQQPQQQFANAIYNDFSSTGATSSVDVNGNSLVTSPQPSYDTETREQYLSKQGYYNTSEFQDEIGVDANQKTAHESERNQHLPDAANGGYYTATRAANDDIFLSDEQVHILTEDMGLDANEIDNSQQALYASLDNLNLLDNGDLIAAGGDIIIQAGDGITNNGGIHARGELVAQTSGSINNQNLGTLRSDSDLNLTATDSIYNNQGLIEGTNVALTTTTGDIVNRTEYYQSTVQIGRTTATSTRLGAASSIVSHDNLLLNAGHNLDLQGSTLSAAQDVSLHAGNDVLLEAIREEFGTETRKHHGGYDNRNDVTYDVVDIDAGGSLAVSAGHDLVSQGATFTAGGDVALSAGNELNLDAVLESHHQQRKTVKKHTFSKKVKVTDNLHQTVEGTQITSGGDILLNAGKDAAGNIALVDGNTVNMVGAELNATGNIVANGDNINITAGTYQDYDYSHTSKKSFGGLKSKSKTDLEQTYLLDGSTLNAGQNILINADQNITVVASDLNAGQSIQLQAMDDVLISSGEERSRSEHKTSSGGLFSGGKLFSSKEILDGNAKVIANDASLNANQDLLINAGSATVVGSTLNAGGDLLADIDVGDINIQAAQQTEQSYHKEKSISVGFGDVFNSITDPVGTLKDSTEHSMETGRASFTLFDADYHQYDTKTDTVTHKGSELNASGDIQLNSAGNIGVIGSALTADADHNQQGDLLLNAGGNIAISDSIDTQRTQTSSLDGTAKVSAMVTNEYGEAALAAKAVLEATKQLEDARKSYQHYKKEKSQLKAEIEQLETALANGEPGIDSYDLEDIKEQLDMLNDDENWYVANIALATENLTTKTIYLVQKTTTAAESSYTWGFDIGAELDIDATKTHSTTDVTQSQGSALSGENIALTTGDKSEALIQGSVVNANHDLLVDAGQLTMNAGVSTSDSRFSSKHGNVNISQTVWGAATGPAINASYDQNASRDHATRYNNAVLQADNIGLNIKGDADLEGATLRAEQALSATIGGDLSLISQQNRSYGSHHGFGISGGISSEGVKEDGTAAGGKEPTTAKLGEFGKFNGANGGFNISNGRYNNKDTVLSSITAGGPITIDVAGHTQLTGSVIASEDEAGNDLGLLDFHTGSLDVTHLIERHYQSDQDYSFSASVSIDTGKKKNQDNTAGTPINPPLDHRGDPVSLNGPTIGLHNTRHNDRSKTLATLGQGNVTVDNNPDTLDAVNRDVSAVDKDLYSIDSNRGDVDATLDLRLLTDDGRNEIAGQTAYAIERIKNMGSTIYDGLETLTDSLGLTGLTEEERSDLIDDIDEELSSENLAQHRSNSVDAQDEVLMKQLFGQNAKLDQDVTIQKENGDIVTISYREVMIDFKQRGITALINFYQLVNDPELNDIQSAHLDEARNTAADWINKYQEVSPIYSMLGIYSSGGLEIKIAIESGAHTVEGVINYTKQLASKSGPYQEQALGLLKKIRKTLKNTATDRRILDTINVGGEKVAALVRKTGQVLKEGFKEGKTAEKVIDDGHAISSFNSADGLSSSVINDFSDPRFTNSQWDSVGYQATSENSTVIWGESSRSPVSYDLDDTLKDWSDPAKNFNNADVTGYSYSGAGLDVASKFVKNNDLRKISGDFQKELDRGGSYLMTEDQFDQYVKLNLEKGFPIGRPDGQFMTSSSEMNHIINETGGDSEKLGRAFGVDSWAGHSLIRMDVEKPNLLNPRLPDPSVSGVNNNFIPGGKTIGGIPEIITDPIPSIEVWPTKVEP